MSTLVAMIVAIIVLGMLIAYHMGFAVGRREGFNDGFQSGKKEGAVRAYAVGYDRGRHDRQAKPAEDSVSEPASAWRDRLNRWLLPAILSVIAIVLAAVFSAKELSPPDRDFNRPPNASKLRFE